MRLVNHDDRLLAGGVALLQRAVQLSPGIAAIEARSQPQLPEHLMIKVARRKLRVGDVERRLGGHGQAGEEGVRLRWKKASYIARLLQLAEAHPALRFAAVFALFRQGIQIARALRGSGRHVGARVIVPR